MLKKVITYEDFNGEECAEEVWFGITKTEIIKAELAGAERMTDTLRKMINLKDGQGIMRAFDKLVDMSYGVKSADGKRFEKSPELLAKFKSSAAYDSLYMEIMSDTDKALAFIKGIMPAEIGAQLDTPEIQKKIDEYVTTGKPI